MKKRLKFIFKLVAFSISFFSLCIFLILLIRYEHLIFYIRLASTMNVFNICEHILYMQKLKLEAKNKETGLYLYIHRIFAYQLTYYIY